MTVQDVDFLIDKFKGLTDSLLIESPSEFAERFRFLSSDLTPFPGRFSYERFPYFRKIVDCFSPADPTREVVLMKGNQMGATTAVLETIVLYNIASDPKAQMYVTVTEGLAKTGVKIKIEKLIDNAGVRNLIFSQNRKRAGSRDTGDTVTEKQYPGGFIHFYGSNSPSRFRSMSYPVAIVDELDGFKSELEGEGSILTLIKNRTDAYSKKRKIFWCSTPLTKQNSLIEKKYEEGDQQKYYVPCKHCGTMQELVWHLETKPGERYGIVWENDQHFNPRIETVAYRCPHCGGIMRNYDKATIIPKGQWRPTAKGKIPFIKSFHLSALYNPPGMYSWEDMVIDWAACWDIENNRIKDKEAYRTFRNTKQALTFEDSNITLKYETARSYRRDGFAERHIPNKMATKDSGSSILVVIASVDVQKNGLYVDVKGYSMRGVTWTLCFDFLDGDTADFNGPWDKLATFLEDTRFIGDDDKVYRIAMTLVDSGWNTEYVYAFAARFPSGVYACKGVDYLRAGETYKSFDKGTLERIGLPVAYHINTTKMKDRINNSMNVLTWNKDTLQPGWYCNFPKDFGDDYFRMFEAEDRVDEYDQYRRYRRTIWKPRYGVANHAFDTYGYNMAALEIFADAYCREVLELPGIDWNEFWEAIKDGGFFE
jgi:phage terminase large subunit GpA-like protein